MKASKFARRQARMLFRECWGYDPITEGPPPKYEWGYDMEFMSEHKEKRLIKVCEDNDFALSLTDLSVRFNVGMSSVIHALLKHGVYEKSVAMRERKLGWL